jgi:hypothetical protein
MNVLTLRSSITTALGAAIGTYTLANGSTTPAVAVRDRGEAVAPGTTVTGLEVVIVSQPSLLPVRQYTNYKAQQEWSVYLVAWTAGVDLEGAATTLLATFGNSDITTVTLSEGTGPRNEMQLSIRT